MHYNAYDVMNLAIQTWQGTRAPFVFFLPHEGSGPHLGLEQLVDMIGCISYFHMLQVSKHIPYLGASSDKVGGDWELGEYSFRANEELSGMTHSEAFEPYQRMGRICPIS